MEVKVLLQKAALTLRQFVLDNLDLERIGY